MNTLTGVWALGGGYVAFFVAGFLASEPWRWGGAILGRDIDVNSELFQWVRAVSSAIIAGLVARVLVYPTGALIGVPLAVRLAAIATTVVVYLAAKRSLGAGILAGGAVLVVGDWLLG